jgi:tetratricopeptide (TPR) repeat protein
MRSKWLACLLLGISSLSLPLAAQEAATEESTKETAPKWSPEFHKAFYEAAAAFNKRDFAAALAKLDEAEKLQPKVAEAANLRGAVMVEEKKYEEGARLFREALALNPKLYSAKFNLAELPFLQKKYAEARTAFEALRAENPKDELVQFKIFLTYLLEKNDEAAKAELEKIKFPSDTPAYYFAHAAWDFAHGNDAGAKSWMDSSQRVFDAPKNIFFATTFYELGWLKNRPDPNQPRQD